MTRERHVRFRESGGVRLPSATRPANSPGLRLKAAAARAAGPSALPKNKHELFAQGLAKGLGIGAAYKAAGYKPSPAAATRLSKNVKLQERAAELQAPSAERATVTRQWMLERLKQNVERCMQATPVLDHEGNPTGKYKFAGNAANKALELLGKALGMFTKRGA